MVLLDEEKVKIWGSSRFLESRRGKISRALTGRSLRREGAGALTDERSQGCSGVRPGSLFLTLPGFLVLNVKYEF